jgi:hypothetical protein
MIDKMAHVEPFAIVKISADVLPEFESILKCSEVDVLQRSPPLSIFRNQHDFLMFNLCAEILQAIFSRPSPLSGLVSAVQLPISIS